MNAERIKALLDEPFDAILARYVGPPIPHEAIAIVLDMAQKAAGEVIARAVGEREARLRALADKWEGDRLNRAIDKEGAAYLLRNLLDDYDPVPGLVARGVMSDEHDPDSCELECCTPGADSHVAHHERMRAEHLPACPICRAALSGVSGPTTEGASE